MLDMRGWEERCDQLSLSSVNDRPSKILCNPVNNLLEVKETMEMTGIGGLASLKSTEGAKPQINATPVKSVTSE